MPVRMPPASRTARDRVKIARSPEAARPAVENQEESPLSESVRRADAGPGHLTAHDVLALQRAVGNRMVVRMVAPPPARPRVQRSVTVGAAHDEYEQEADRVSEQVMASPASRAGPGPASAGPASQPAIHRAPQPGVLQRMYLDTADPAAAWQAAWQKVNSTFFGMVQKKDPASAVQVQNILTLLALYRSAKAENSRAALRKALTDLQTALADWISSQKAEKLKLGILLSKEVNQALADLDAENAKIDALKTKIKTDYGIDVDTPEAQQAGIDAVQGTYTNAPEAVRQGLKTRDWTLQELTDLDAALANYKALLGPDRQKAGLGDQPVTTFSRLKQGIDENTAKGKLDTSTGGETFRTPKNITMFDAGNRCRDFVKDPAHPKAEEFRQGFRGTIEHELSHILIESMMLPSHQKAIDKFVDDMSFWDAFAASDYWRTATDTKSPRGGFACDWGKTTAAAGAASPPVEVPITRYGSKTAGEDLAEAMMFYFEDPEKLAGQCPLRSQWITNNIITNMAPPSTPAPPTEAPTTGSAPSTPAPETPAPQTPAPQTPAPETPAPQTPAPQTPAPETPAPQTPAPETPAPQTLEEEKTPAQ